MRRRRGELVSHGSGHRLVNLPSAHETHCGLWKHLKTGCHAREFLEYCEAGKHPDLIGMRNAILRSACRKMPLRLNANLIEIICTWRGKTADACPVERNFRGTAGNRPITRSTGGVNADSSWIQP